MKLDTTAQEFGSAIGKSAASSFVSNLAIAILIGMALLWLTNQAFLCLGVGKDDTDRNKMERSGLSLHTDHKTGVQYLSSPNGGLTPRLDRDGRPVIVDVETQP